MAGRCEVASIGVGGAGGGVCGAAEVAAPDPGVEVGGGVIENFLSCESWEAAEVEVGRLSPPMMGRPPGSPPPPPAAPPAPHIFSTVRYSCGQEKNTLLREGEGIKNVAIKVLMRKGACKQTERETNDPLACTSVDPR